MQLKNKKNKQKLNLIKDNIKFNNKIKFKKLIKNKFKIILIINKIKTKLKIKTKNLKINFKKLKKQKN